MRVNNTKPLLDLEQLKHLAELKLTRKEAAEIMGVTLRTINRNMIKWGVNFDHDPMQTELNAMKKLDDSQDVLATRERLLRAQMKRYARKENAYMRRITQLGGEEETNE